MHMLQTWKFFVYDGDQLRLKNVSTNKNTKVSPYALVRGTRNKILNKIKQQFSNK